MSNFEKRLTDILTKACEYETTKSITTAVEVTEDLVDLAHDLIKVVEIFGEEEE